MQIQTRKSIVILAFAAALATLCNPVSAFAQTTTLSFGADIGEIAILTYSIETTAESSWSKGGGASIGKPAYGPLRFTAARDSSTFNMLQYIGVGQSAPLATLTVRPARGTDFITYTFTDIFFTGVGQSAQAEKPHLQIDGAFVWKTVTIRSSTNGTASCIAINVPAGTVDDNC
jgi:type VI protein secretion system component Hcp